MIRSVLIANRGEIACRVIRACRALGLRTIAVHSDADADSLHRQLADVSVPIGPGPAVQSYLRVEQVLAAAHEQGADAVHPGYGFLAENAAFARAVQAAGMAWIGPDPDTMARMGDKAQARFAAQASGVPVLPGSAPLDPAQAQQWAALAREVGYPLLVKAVGGGGGIGMRRVDSEAALQTTVEAAQKLAAKAFSRAEVYLERYVELARHVEIQVFGDGRGGAVHLFERECSVQRRFQKIVEESSAPGVSPAVLQRMAQAAVALTAQQRYSGAGTVEFVLDARTQDFYFLEMNTRIQVEHAVTEMVTGVDLVQRQILQAGGLAAAWTQDDIRRQGAAIECRIYAENPARQFMPSPGRLQRLQLPALHADLRIDTGVREGDTVSPFYDPMIAKLIARGADRAAALRTMDAALQQVRIEGIAHNTEFLRAVLAHEDFAAGRIDTGFVERERSALLGLVAA